MLDVDQVISSFDLSDKPSGAEDVQLYAECLKQILRMYKEHFDASKNLAQMLQQSQEQIKIEQTVVKALQQKLDTAEG